MQDVKRKVIAVDLDGTLCKGEYWGAGFPEPKREMIELIRKLFVRGAIIIIYTARDTEMATKTYAWLDYHGVPYHGVMMRRKPGADLYVDDKAVTPEMFKEMMSDE